MSISITISPEAAVQAGARWRILGHGEENVWLGSGDVASGLEPRHYQIAFAPAMGWREPQSLRVRNVHGFTNGKTAAYTPLSFYELGQIPRQTVWHGQWLEFMIPAGESGAIKISCDPTPEGELSMDPGTGLFRYKPGAGDRFPFSVTLTSEDGGKAQTFEITPMPILLPEVDVFGGPLVAQPVAPPSVHPPTLAALAADEEPPPLSEPFSMEVSIVPSTFLEIEPAPEQAIARDLASTSTAYDAGQPDIEMIENEAELFNHEARTTHNVRVIGESVVLAAGSEPYNTLHENPAIKRLDVYAETVMVRSPLHLPQTTVSIYARELCFEDQAGSDSYLSTVPLDFLTGAEPARREGDTIVPSGAGQPGARSGDISLQIESFQAPDPGSKRFILTGGRGQDPGTGLDGRDGTKLEEKTEYYQAKFKSAWRMVYAIHYSKSSGFDTTKHHPWGVKAWPTDGENATPAGTPGAGGDGGTFAATLDLAAQADVTGGAPGQRGRIYNGGAQGSPHLAAMVESWNKHEEPFGPHRWGWRYLEHPGWNYINQLPSGNQMRGYITKPGAAAASPAGTSGNPGKAVQTGHPLSWLHPLLLNEILDRAKNRYLRGDLAAAQEKIEEYAELLDIYQSLEAWNELDDTARLELGRIRNEIAMVLSRLDCHLDYFGNPAGWVPMLSFEVNRTIFDNEIDMAIEVLYLTYWLREKAEDDRQRVDALQQLEVQLKQEIQDLKDRYAQATEMIPELDMEAGKISNEIGLLQEKLKNLEEELREQAEEELEEPWWKTGLKLAGTLCTVVPVMQPALGAVGGLMNLGADFDEDDPWKTIIGAADIAKTYGDQVAEKAEGAASLLAGKVDPSSAAFVAKESAAALQGWTSALSDGIRGVSKVMSERQAPKSEVDALLQKLEAESEEFQQLSGELSDLLERKMEFARKLADALQLVSGIPNAITTNLLGLDSAGSAIAKGKEVLHDGRLTMYLNAMERRAKERLLKYHYYLAKSYEYRLLRRYQGQLDLDRVFDEMERLAQLNIEGEKPFQLSKEQFGSLKAIYHEALSSIAEEIFDAYNQDRPELSAPRRFSLTSAEIGKLNAGEPVSLNLMELGLFRLNEENVRVVDLEVERPEVSVEGGGERRLAELDLRFEHSGVSQLRQGGRAIRFRHSAREGASSIAWGARYDAIDGRIDPIKPSAASDSLLRSLLKSDTATTLMLYSRPAAWADITVSREVNADPGTVVKIEDLRLNVTYDFTRETPGVRMIQVKAAPESAHLNPYFALDRVDLIGRSDGRGAFYRAYKGLVTVEVVAQECYGRWIFKQWTNQAGRMLGKSPRLTVQVDDDQVLRAVYALDE